MTEVALFTYFNSIAPLSADTWQAVSPLFHQKTLRKHVYFAQAGPVADTFAFLSEGIMRVFYRSPDGVEYNKHFFTPPTTIGAYSSLVTGKPNLIYQQALSDCLIWVVNYAQFNACCDRYADLERVARRNAELYFAQKEQREVDLVMLDAGQRYEQFSREYPHLEQLIPQYHIASYLGVTPTQLSRIRRVMAGR